MQSLRLSILVALSSSVVIACTDGPIHEVGEVSSGGASRATSGSHTSTPSAGSGGIPGSGGTTGGQTSTVSAGSGAIPGSGGTTGGQTSTPSAGNGGTSGFGGTTGSQNADCNPYPDEKGTGVDIVVTNQRQNPIYVGSRESLCNVDNQYSILDAAGASVRYESGNCATCESIGVNGSCTFVCNRSPLTRVMPGASLTLHWNGTLFAWQALSLPTTCKGFDQEGCFQEQAAIAGNYTVKVVASSAVGCLWGDCSCVQNDTCAGTMITGYGTGELYEAMAEVRVPDQTRVSVTFTE